MQDASGGAPPPFPPSGPAPAFPTQASTWGVPHQVESPLVPVAYAYPPPLFPPARPTLAARIAHTPNVGAVLLLMLLALLAGLWAVDMQEGVYLKMDQSLVAADSIRLAARCSELQGLLTQERARTAALEVSRGSLEYKVASQRSQLTKADRQRATLNATLLQEREVHAQREAEAEEDRVQAEGASVSYQRKMGDESRTNLENLIVKSAQYSNLDRAHDLLKRDYDKTCSNLSELQKMHAQLIAEHRQLGYEYNHLQDAYRDLQGRFNLAVEQVQELDGQLSSARSQYNALVDRYNNLLNEYYRLRSYVR